MNTRNRLPRMLAHGLAIAALAVSGSACAQGDQFRALEKLAEKKNPRAIYHLGMMYLTGSSVERDGKRALRYFREAAELGDPLASYKMGCFYDGQYDLVEPDLYLALKYNLVAAEAGYALAQQDVAGLFYRKQDFSNAVAWLERAVAQGTPDALATYASIHNGAPGIARDAAKTDAYFRLYLQTAEGTAKQREWLKDFEAKLTPAERVRSAEIVRAFKARPTPLTLEALSGARAAEALIKASS